MVQPQPSPNVDVIVIGAGLAGLSAGYMLVSAGLSVICLEARERIGGRVVSHQLGNGAVDLGATWIWRGEQLVHSFVEQFNVALHPQSMDGNALLDRGEFPEELVGNPIDAPASRFTSGAQSLVDAFAAALPEGTIRLNEPVSRIHAESDRVSVAAASGTFVADHALIALPPALAVDTIVFVPALPGDLYAVARETSVWMGQTLKAVAMYDEPFWKAAGWSGSAISYHGPFVEFHDHSGPDGHPAALFAFAPSERFPSCSASEIGETFRKQLVRLFGSVAGQPRDVHILDWSREQYTTPANQSPTASTANFGHPIFRQPALGDRVWWASTETSSAQAGHLEGALRAASQAAQQILNNRLLVSEHR